MWDNLKENSDTSVNVFSRKSPETFWYAFVCSYMTIGNLAMHGFCSPGGHKLDITSMSLWIAFPFARMFEKLLFVYKKSANVRRIGFAIFYIVLSTMMVTNDIYSYLPIEVDDIYVHGLPWLFIVEIVYARNIEKKKLFMDPWFLFAGIIFFAGYAMWWFGQDDGVACNPGSLFQFHAVWHCTSAISIWMIWEAMRND